MYIYNKLAIAPPGNVNLEIQGRLYCRIGRVTENYKKDPAFSGEVSPKKKLSLFADGLVVVVVYTHYAVCRILIEGRAQ